MLLPLYPRRTRLPFGKAGDVGYRSPRFFPGGDSEKPPAKRDAAAGRDNFRLGLCASPADGHQKGTVFLPGRRAKCDESPPAARRGANETVVPTCRGDFLQVVSGMCPDFFRDSARECLLFCRPRRRRAGGRGKMPLPVQAGEMSAARPARKKYLPSANDASAEEFCPCGPLPVCCGSGAEATAQIRKKTIQSARQAQTRAASGSGVAQPCPFSSA